MGKQKSLLHKSSRDYDTSNPTYACGAPVEHNPNLTDAQAMALDRCPNCFPKGFNFTGVVGKAKTAKTGLAFDPKTGKAKVVEELRARGIGGAWL